MNNYRPVSLTSVVVKIFERILKGNVVEFLERNEIINDTQHGFRKNRSCLTNLLEYMDFVTGEINNGNPVDIDYI